MKKTTLKPPSREQQVTVPKISSHRYQTPPQYAARLGVKAETVLAWIRSGELCAVNTATKQSTRPRWKIPPDAIVAFENGRTVQPTVASRRRRKKQPDDVVQYF